jgi:hypothetical protein
MPDQAGNRNIDHFLLCTLETKNRNSPFPAFHGCGLSNEKNIKRVQVGNSADIL